MPSRLIPTGYLIVDHSNSPGLPNAPGGKLTERDTLRCEHCHRQMIKNPLRDRPRNYCRHCDAYICDECAVVQHVSGKHEPLAEVFDKAEQLAHKNSTERIGILRRSILGP